LFEGIREGELHHHTLCIPLLFGVCFRVEFWAVGERKEGESKGKRKEGVDRKNKTKGSVWRGGVG